MGAQNLDNLTPEALNRFDWDALRILLAVAFAGSFNAASEQLGLSVNTLRNHVRRLEDVSGLKLLERSHRGVEPTKAGQRMLEIAREMASASKGVGGNRAPDIDMSAQITLCVTEGVGTFWLIPRLAEFHDRNPDIKIGLECSMEPVNEIADTSLIAVQLVRPQDPDAVCTRLATLHLMPFGSEQYFKRHGIPKSLADVRSHRLVVQTGEQMNNTILSSLFGDELPKNLIALETNSSSAHYWAIARGIGIGMLPTYARAITRMVEPIDMGFQLRRDLWLAHSPSAANDRRLMAVIDWLKRSFNPMIYPWFSDEFIHPAEFDRDFENMNVVRLFAGFMDLPAKIA